MDIDLEQFKYSGELEIELVIDSTNEVLTSHPVHIDQSPNDLMNNESPIVAEQEDITDHDVEIIAVPHVPLLNLKEEVIEETMDSDDHSDNGASIAVDPLIGVAESLENNNAEEVAIEGAMDSDDHSDNSDISIVADSLIDADVESPKNKRKIHLPNFEDDVVEVPIKRSRGAPKKGPFLCDVCSREEQHFSRLKAHIKQAHGQRDLLCPFDGCTSAFALQKYFNEHLKHVHGTTMKKL